MSITILSGDVRDVLATLPDDTFDCIVTSPPYWGLRDYGVAGQIGLEPTLTGYLDTMTAVCRDLRRVLKPEGTFWLNIGDSYAGSWGAQGRTGQLAGRSVISARQIESHPKAKSGTGSLSKTPGLKSKDLCMVPNRLAIRLQEDGWYVRSEIIWHKPNPMPESVTDRPTSSHEKVWLLTKSERYAYDADAVRESAEIAERPQQSRAKALARERGLTDEHIAALRACGVNDAGKAQQTQSGFGKNTPEAMSLAAEAKAALGGYYREFLTGDAGRNARNVWSISSQPFSGAHFATMPPDLVDRCIKAGCPKGGHVLDPFGGAGTTGLAADRLGRDATLIELNPAYIEIARNRIEDDSPLFAEVCA